MTEPTPRQLSVLIAWIEEGGTREAAARLGCHPDTVRHNLAELQVILGAANSAQAFAIAIVRGLVDPHDLRVDEAA
jgi:DNA-binding CsgD family transcriptional regulator